MKLYTWNNGSIITVANSQDDARKQVVDEAVRQAHNKYPSYVEQIRENNAFCDYLKTPEAQAKYAGSTGCFPTQHDSPIPLEQFVDNNTRPIKDYVLGVEPSEHEISWPLTILNEGNEFYD